MLINNWVEEKTQTKIKNLLPDGSINSMTAAVLVNAVYFKVNVYLAQAVLRHFTFKFVKLIVFSSSTGRLA